MSIIQAILLGMLQGVAEFLPISSSGHLTIVEKIFGFDENLKSQLLAFNVFLHISTLLAVIIYFRKKILSLLKVFARIITFRPVSSETISDDILTGNEKFARKTVLALIITTAVTGVIGLLVHKFMGDVSLKFTCAGFIITALFLIFCKLAEKNPRKSRKSSEPVDITPKPISPLQALAVGVMQGFGTLPGISRSGSTIAGAKYSGVERKAAGEYSFLASIFAILGAFVIELKDLKNIDIGIAPMIAGAAAAFACGYISLVLLMRIIKKGNLAWFACYLIPLGIAGMFIFK